MPNPTNYQTQLQDAVWIDVNTDFGINTLPDRVPDGLAIVYSSLRNLFNCIPGQRARTFQPTYGSIWLQFIHEPICDMTAQKMETFMIQAIEKWEPRIQVDVVNSSITSDTTIPGYVVRIAFNMPNVPGIQQLQFQVPV
jgi:phage baseplate assembly protein W